MAHKRKSSLSMQMRNSQKQFEHSLVFKTNQKTECKDKNVVAADKGTY